MFLRFDTIESVTCGAVDVTQEADGIHFYRLNKGQLEYYRINNESFYNKALNTSGVMLQFKTTSHSLGLDLTLWKTMGRSYAAVEVFVDDQRIGYINNFDGRDLSGNFAQNVYPCDRHEKRFDLGAGEKTVKVVFPRLTSVILHNVELDDDATVIPVKPEKKALVFGDSITQGFDCLWPTSHYIFQLCRELRAEEFNKAIGGEQYAPHMSRCKEDFIPDYIVAAFGSNDWRVATVEKFQENCRSFYEYLHMNYPGVPVISITPVWRPDIDTVKDLVHFGPIHEIEEYVRQITAPYENVTVIRGYELIPHDVNYYGDLRLHPSDEGFACYGKNLIRALKESGFLSK